MLNALSALVLMVLISPFAQAKLADFKCTGVNREGEKLTIIWDSWSDNRNSSRVDLTFENETIGPRTYVDLHTYIDSEGGFDFGVSTSDFQLLLFFPYQVENPTEVDAGYYYGGEYSVESRVMLKCKKTRVPKIK